MTLFYKLSSLYKRLSIFILLLLISVKNKLGSSRAPLFVTQILVAFLWKVTFLRKITVNKAVVINTNTSAFKNKQGFTLVELMVTLTVVAIIITIAAPIIQTQLASMEAKRVKNQLENTLSLAKAESYIRRENVLVCLSNTGEHCHRDADKTLLLFIDKNDNNDFDAQIDFLLTQHSLNLRYSKLSLRVGAKRHYIKFWGDSGTPRGHFGHIKYCPTVAYNKAMYLISFNQTGKVKQKLNENHPTKCDE